MLSILLFLMLFLFIYRSTVVFHNDRDNIHYFAKPFSFGRDYFFESKDIKQIVLDYDWSSDEGGGRIRSSVTLNDGTSFSFIHSKVMTYMLVDYARQQGHVAEFIDEISGGEYIV